LGEATIKRNSDKSDPEHEPLRHVGAGLQVRMPPRKQRSMPETLAVFAVIPSLLLWTMILLALGGDFKAALQIACTTIAAGFVGFYLGEVRE